MRLSLLTTLALILALVALPAVAGDSAPQQTEAVQAAAEAKTPTVTLDDLFRTEVEPLFTFGGNCNQVVCGEGTFCCNYSCSTCAPLGGYCTQQICPQYE